MIASRSWVAAAAWGLDRLAGEPPVQLHPVVWFGNAMKSVEAGLYGDARSRGLAHCLVGVGLGAGVGRIAQRLLGPAVANMVVATVAMAGAMLEAEGLRVADALEHDGVAEARARLANLVGRETANLNETEIARAVVESLAENTVDAVTATMFWATVAGPTGAAMHRCANTMDAMVGHHSSRYEHYGWASARLDDLANWLPARLTALAVMVAEPGRAADVARIVRRDSSQHPSPNGGVVEAAFAAALDVQLGGANTYGDRIEDRGVLGDGRHAHAHDIRRAADLARRVAVVFAVGCAASHMAISYLWTRR